MWRHEDVFFGAMGGAGGGGTPVATPEEIAERCLVPRTRCVPACPFMHGTAHWMAFSTLFLGGTVDHPDRSHTRARAALGADRARAGELPRHRRRRVRTPAARRARSRRDAERRAPRPVVLPGHPLGGRHPLARARSTPSWNGCPACSWSTDYGASETGGQGQSVTVAGGPVASAPTFTVNDETTVLDENLHQLPAGVIGLLARRGHIPLGYYKDPEKTAATFPVVDGVRWSVPGDHACIEDDGTITLLGRGLGLDQHRRREGLPRGSRVGAEGARRRVRRSRRGRARSPLRRAGRRGRPDARPGVEPDRDALQDHLRGHLAGYKMPREVVTVDQIVRSPSGKPDYRWARGVAIERLGATPGADGR